MNKQYENFYRQRNNNNIYNNNNNKNNNNKTQKETTTSVLSTYVKLTQQMRWITKNNHFNDQKESNKIAAFWSEEDIWVNEYVPR